MATLEIRDCEFSILEAEENDPQLFSRKKKVVDASGYPEIIIAQVPNAFVISQVSEARLKEICTKAMLVLGSEKLPADIVVAAEKQRVFNESIPDKLGDLQRRVYPSVFLLQDNIDNQCVRKRHPKHENHSQEPKTQAAAEPKAPEIEIEIQPEKPLNDAEKGLLRQSLGAGTFVAVFGVQIKDIVEDMEMQGFFNMLARPYGVVARLEGRSVPRFSQSPQPKAELFDL